VESGSRKPRYWRAPPFLLGILKWREADGQAVRLLVQGVGYEHRRENIGETGFRQSTELLDTEMLIGRRLLNCI
jgi:hypothetical protein